LRAAKIGKTHSAETKVLIGIAKGTAIYVYDSQGLLVNSFTSARKAAKYFDVSKDTILNYVKKSKIFKEQWFLTTILISSQKVNSD
jgi:group I intron endonuclease